MGALAQMTPMFTSVARQAAFGIMASESDILVSRDFGYVVTA